MRFECATWLVALVSAAGLSASSSGEARADASVAIVWTSTTGAGTPGGSSIGAAPGDQLIAEIRITADAAGVAAYGVSLEFDTDLGNELNLVSATELLPAGMTGKITSGLKSTQESTAGQKGNALLFESITLGGPGPASVTFVAGTVTFAVTANVTSDGADVFSGKFDIQDGAVNNAYSVFTPIFASASVNSLAVPVPTLSPPGTVVVSLLLLVGALGGLGWRRFVARV